MKQRIMETGCVISFSAPFIIISPTTFREKLTGGHQPRTAALNITQRSTYGLFEQFTTQTAYGLTATILRREKCRESQMYSSGCACVNEPVWVFGPLEQKCHLCRAAVIFCTDWRLTGCIQEHTRTPRCQNHTHTKLKLLHLLNIFCWRTAFSRWNWSDGGGKQKQQQYIQLNLLLTGITKTSKNAFHVKSDWNESLKELCSGLSFDTVL